MASDAELGGCIRQLIEQTLGPGSCSMRVVQQEIVRACEEELRLRRGAVGRESLQRSRYESPIRNASPITDIRKRFDLNQNAAVVVPARRPVRPTSPPPPPPLLSRGVGVQAPSRPLDLLQPDSLLSPVGGGSSFPRLLSVVCPEKPNINGDYHLLETVVNGLPMWGCLSLRLYSTCAGYWMFTASPSGPDRDTGLVESLTPHGGSSPHLIHNWQYFATRWIPSGTVVSLVENLAEEGPAHDNRSIVR
eukprot:TRINITY_DN20382_c0_g1_i1.p1 TRINITY_DN20382_c0_g1~~TRINITY_DN20382_c0_g1_i1.p1  ORF type:complete len:248 (+),score=16.53 TRINITY_DN20382_c0_g1_i1:95-838(+)